MGIRSVAGFLIGCPDDTQDSILRVLDYAKSLSPTFANFNVVTPYPGTKFFEQIKDQIADADFSRYTVYAPVLKYKHLTATEMAELHAKCFGQFYFRWPYLRDNAYLLWPSLGWLGIARKPAVPGAEAAQPGVPGPHGGLDVLRCRGLRPDGPHQSSRQPSHTSQLAGRRRAR
jgi:hypothetical protein